MRKALFIDKDGTLIENVPFNVDPAQVRFVDGALPALQRLSAAGYALVLVTNQSGLALGCFNRADFARLQASLQRRLRDEAGLSLLDVEVCPHAPGPQGRPMCLCRKPAPGMLRRAACRHQIDLRQSWMVGDILDDVEAGHRAGCRAVLLDTGGETVWRRSPLREPEVQAASWEEVATAVIESPPASALAANDWMRPTTTALAGPRPGRHDRAWLRSTPGLPALGLR